MIKHWCFWLRVTYDEDEYFCSKTGTFHTYEQMSEKCENCRERARK